MRRILHYLKSLLKNTIMIETNINNNYRIRTIELELVKEQSFPINQFWPLSVKVTDGSIRLKLIENKESHKLTKCELSMQSTHYQDSFYDDKTGMGELIVFLYEEDQEIDILPVYACEYLQEFSFEDRVYHLFYRLNVLCLTK